MKQEGQFLHSRKKMLNVFNQKGGHDWVRKSIWYMCVCVFLLAQWCLTLCDHMDCSSPGSSVHGDPPGNIGVGCYALLQGISPTQGLNPGLPHCRQMLHHLSHQRSPIWYFSLVQFSSAAQSCLTLCDPMNCSTPGLSIRHQLPEFTQTHVHQVGDAIQPSQLLSPVQIG